MAKKALSVTIPSTVSHEDVKQVKIYHVKGVDGQFRTSSNWKAEGKAPIKDAFGTSLTTKNGYDVKLFHESVVDMFDYEAEMKKRAALKDLNAEMREVMKAFMAHEIDAKRFTKRQAEIARAITELSSL